MNAKKVFSLGVSFALMIGISIPFSSHAFAASTPTTNTVTSIESDGTVTTSTSFTPSSDIDDSNAQSSALAPISNNDIQYDINKNLTQEEISERFAQIDATYEVGEAFSPEDAEFVRIYAVPISDNSTTTPTLSPNSISIQSNSLKFGNSASESFSKSKSEYGVSVKFTGSIFSDMGLLDSTYGGNVKENISRGSSKVKSIKDVVTNTAYGLVGEGLKVGLVYDGSISFTSSSHTTCNMDKSKQYGAIGVVYTYTNAYTQVSTSSGSFDLYAF